MPGEFTLPQYDLVEANSVNFTEKAENADKACASCKFYRQSVNGCFLVDAKTSDGSGCSRHEPVQTAATENSGESGKSGEPGKPKDAPETSAPAADPPRDKNRVSLGQGEVNYTKEPTKGTCGNCRWFNPYDWKSDGTGSCTIVADDVEASHGCDRFEAKPEDTVSANSGKPGDVKMPRAVNVVSPAEAVDDAVAKNSLRDGWHDTPEFLLGRITGMEEAKALAPRVSMNRRIRKAGTRLIAEINSRQQEVWDKLRTEHGVRHGE